MRNKKTPFIGAVALSLPFLFFGFLGCSDSDKSPSTPSAESSSSVSTKLSSSAISSEILNGDVFSCTTNIDNEKNCADYVGFVATASVLQSMIETCEADGGIASTTKCESGATLSCVMDISNNAVTTIYFYDALYSMLTCADLNMEAP